MCKRLVVRFFSEHSGLRSFRYTAIAMRCKQFNGKQCCVFVGSAVLYLVLSASLAFFFHRVFFYDTPPIEVITSVFAGFVFVFTLCGLMSWTGFRVFVFLLFPKLFNVNGRTVLIAYISYLTLSGPVWNSTRNIGVMSSTLVCAFEELRKSAEEIQGLLRQPVVYIKHTLDTMERRSKAIFERLADNLRQVEHFAKNMRGCSNGARGVGWAT